MSHRCAVTLLAALLGACAAELADDTWLTTSRSAPPDDEQTTLLIPPDDEGGSARETVIGGTVTWEHTEIGSLSVGCTGTLVAPNVVITAAHCMSYGSSDRAGNYGSFTTYRTSGAESGEYTIARYRSFGGSVGDDDICLLQLSSDVPATVATPALVGLAQPARGTNLTVWGFGCTNRGYGTDWKKRKFDFLAGQTTYNLCPGDSGGPVTGPRGEVLRVNSGYYVGPGDDIFGDVGLYSARVVEQIRAYRPGWDPGTGGGDAGGGGDPGGGGTDPGGDAPDPGGMDTTDPCNAYAATCEACVPIAGCGYCGATSKCVSVDRAGAPIRGCASDFSLNPGDCPTGGGDVGGGGDSGGGDSGGGGLPEAPPPAPPAPPPPADRCGIYAPWPEYTCRRAGRGFVRCQPENEPQFLVCPDGYGCVPGSTRLTCYWGR